MSNLLEVQNLRTYFQTKKGVVKAVDDVSFSIKRGETVGLVGESGSGKSVLSLSIMGLVPKPGRIVAGKILFQLTNIGTPVDLLTLSKKQMRSVRGAQIAMIFQEPMTALNPVFTVGDQIAEAIELHQGGSNQQIREQTIEMLNLVKIPMPHRRVDDYPHQLSGGQRQRVMIAMALACNPSLLIADEPTTALDVTVQAQILDLMIELQEKLNMALLMVTHDFGVVAEVADRVIVMKHGKKVEEGDVVQMFESPQHSYTQKLLQAIPRLKMG